jgi:hypothetical protein
MIRTYKKLESVALKHLQEFQRAMQQSTVEPVNAL